MRRFLPFAAVILIALMLAVVIGPHGSRSAIDGVAEQPPAPQPAATADGESAPGSMNSGGVGSPAAAEQQLIRNPFAASEYAHAGFSTVADPAGLYEHRIAAARAGSPAAMLDVARAVQSCQDGFSTGSAESAFVLYENALITYGHYEYLLDTIELCAPMKASLARQFPDMPAGVFGTEIAKFWRLQAASSGDSTGRLVSLADLPLQDREMAELLDKLVDAGDPEVLDQAAMFNAGRASEENEIVETQRWLYLGCINHELCSAPTYRANLSLQYSPADVAQIVEFAENFETLEQSGVSFVALHEAEPHRYPQHLVDQYVDYLRNEGLEDVVGDAAIIALAPANQAPVP